MARLIVNNKFIKPKKRRPGIHAKSKTSKIKTRKKVKAGS
jgi:hypothetical protein